MSGRQRYVSAVRTEGGWAIAWFLRFVQFPDKMSFGPGDFCIFNSTLHYGQHTPRRSFESDSNVYWPLSLANVDVVGPCCSRRSYQCSAEGRSQFTSWSRLDWGELHEYTYLTSVAKLLSVYRDNYAIWSWSSTGASVRSKASWSRLTTRGALILLLTKFVNLLSY